MRSIFLLIFLAVSLNSISQLIPNEKLIPVDHRKKYLDSLVKMIGNKRIVAIGEDTHGTGDFYDLRAAITERLIREKGFTVVILENPHEDMMALQDSLNTVKLDTLMRRHLFAIYQSKQMRDFLTWFKKRSSKQKNLKLVGCDDSFRELLPRNMQLAAAKYNNDTLNKMCGEFILRGQLDRKQFYKKAGRNPNDSLPTEMAYMREAYQLADRIDSFCTGRGYNDSRLKELIFHAKTSYVYYERFALKQPVSRDGVMGERINFYAADPSAKVIVWAHSGHVARYAWLAEELGLMGATVARQYPKDYFSIGLSGGLGSYSYITNRFINDDHDFSDSLLNATLTAPADSSWNGQLLMTKPAAFLVDLHKLTPAEFTEWKKPRMMKMLGYGKQSGRDFYPVSLPELFDVLIFLKKTKHTTALF